MSSNSFSCGVESAGATQLPIASVNDSMTERRPDHQLIVRAGGRVVGLPVASIHWIEADRNYVVLHAADAHHKVRGTLQNIRTLPALAAFVQIHRSTLVNPAHVTSVCAHNTHDWEARLAGGLVLKVGRRYLEQVRQHLLAKLQFPAAVGDRD
jgi:DNA-binding LytR/AlgR family response regulator